LYLPFVGGVLVGVEWPHWRTYLVLQGMMLSRLDA
jgi:hypothetical protein